jgi:hypothetical protein
MTAYRIVPCFPRVERQDRKHAALDAGGFDGRNCIGIRWTARAEPFFGFRELNRSAIKMDL